MSHHTTPASPTVKASISRSVENDAVGATGVRTLIAGHDEEHGRDTRSGSESEEAFGAQFADAFDQDDVEDEEEWGEEDNEEEELESSEDEIAVTDGDAADEAEHENEDEEEDEDEDKDEEDDYEDPEGLVMRVFGLTDPVPELASLVPAEADDSSLGEFSADNRAIFQIAGPGVEEFDGALELVRAVKANKSEAAKSTNIAKQYDSLVSVESAYAGFRDSHDGRWIANVFRDVRQSMLAKGTIQDKIVEVPRSLKAYEALNMTLDDVKSRAIAQCGVKAAVFKTNWADEINYTLGFHSSLERPDRLTMYEHLLGKISTTACCVMWITPYINPVPLSKILYQFEHMFRKGGLFILVGPQQSLCNKTVYEDLKDWERTIQEWGGRFVLIAHLDVADRTSHAHSKGIYFLEADTGSVGLVTGSVNLGSSGLGLNGVATSDWSKRSVLVSDELVTFSFYAWRDADAGRGWVELDEGEQALVSVGSWLEGLRDARRLFVPVEGMIESNAGPENRAADVFAYTSSMRLLSGMAMDVNKASAAARQVASRRAQAEIVGPVAPRADFVKIPLLELDSRKAPSSRPPLTKEERAARAEARKERDADFRAQVVAVDPRAAEYFREADERRAARAPRPTGGKARQTKGDKATQLKSGAPKSSVKVRTEKEGGGSSTEKRAGPSARAREIQRTREKERREAVWRQEALTGPHRPPTVTEEAAKRTGIYRHASEISVRTGGVSQLDDALLEQLFDPSIHRPLGERRDRMLQEVKQARGDDLWHLYPGEYDRTLTQCPHCPKAFDPTILQRTGTNALHVHGCLGRELKEKLLSQYEATVPERCPFSAGQCKEAGKPVSEMPGANAGNKSNGHLLSAHLDKHVHSMQMSEGVVTCGIRMENGICGQRFVRPHSGDGEAWWRIHAEVDHGLICSSHGRYRVDVQYCTPCAEWSVGEAAIHLHAQGHLEHDVEQIGADAKACTESAVQERCPACMFDTDLTPADRWQGYDRAGRLAEHIIRTHYQSGPASRSCQYPTCDPSIVYTKIDYADHLHVVHACNLLNQKAIKAGHQRVDGDETRLRVVDQDLQMRARGAEAAALADNFDESASREFEQLCKFKIKDLRAFLKDKGIVGIQDSSWNRRSLSAKIVDLGFTVKDVKT